LKKKTLLLTGTTGFIGYKFLSYSLTNNFLVIDILRKKNKNNKQIKKLKKFYPNLYKNIFFSSANELSKKLKNIKIDYFINFATLYNNNHTYDQITKFIDSNIMFPSLIYDLINNKTKKIINFGTMMQHSTSKLLTSQNFYTATKNAFEMISNYYAYKNNKTKFYNLKFYESFGDNDKRKKIIPTLIKNYKNNSTTKILSKKLSLNIIHTDDIINSIMILLNNNIKSGSYCIKNDHNIKIYNLINTLNKALDRKIKVKYGNKSTNINFKNKLNNLPKWKPIKNLESKIIKTFKDEANKN
jgi:CDP-paratose synthetase